MIKEQSESTETAASEALPSSSGSVTYSYFCAETGSVKRVDNASFDSYDYFVHWLEVCDSSVTIHKAEFPPQNDEIWRADRRCPEATGSHQSGEGVE